MYGFAPGHSETASGQAALTATITAPNTDSCRTRVQNDGRPATRYAATRAGTTIQPCSIFVMNASPTSAPHQARCLVRPDSTARIKNQPEATSRSTKPSASTTAIASGVFAARAPSRS